VPQHLQPRAQKRGADPDVQRATEALVRGDLETAERIFRKLLGKGTRNPHVYNNLGVIAARRGETDEAIALFEGALHRDANLKDARENLAQLRAAAGIRHFKRGELAEAEAALRSALELAPTRGQVASDLGAVLAAGGRYPEAIECYCQAVERSPELPIGYTNLGTAMVALGKPEEARKVLEKALQIAPDNVIALTNLAGVCETLGQLGRAAALATRALELSPQNALAHNNLGSALLQQGDLDGTLLHYGESSRLAPERPSCYSSFLFTLNNEFRRTPEEIAALHREYDVKYGPAERPPRVRPVRDRGRRLRVGYVSPDFRAHSVAYFFDPLLGAHDRQALEITCYADSASVDGVTRRLRAQAEHWRQVAGLSDAALAQVIADDGIDVLVDLAGHTASNRLRMFAHRAAPVQFSYLGYPATTGVSAIDYRITDAVADPDGAEALHSEQLARLEGGFLCYRPAFSTGEGPQVGLPPCLESGVVTFGSFNSLIKANDGVLDAWATLLRRVPNSRLLLKARAMSEEVVRERLWKKMEERGIARDRVELVPPAPRVGDHLATYGRVDIALDTFPYNGTTTTCEALWMGVPLVTFAGKVHASRVGSSILSRIGLEELSAASVEGYLDVAAALAADKDRLVHLRTTMRDRMACSPLMDAERLAREMEAAFGRAFD
jgi:protein O-GlcNAc transferase